MKRKIIGILIVTLLITGIFTQVTAINVEKDDEKIEKPQSIEFWPSKRHGHAMVYNERVEKIILFGGDTEDGCSDETWVYDYNNNKWTKKETHNSPPPRKYHSMVYLNDWGLVFMFGGQGNVGCYDDTWIYDFNTNSWNNITNPSNPRPSPRQQTAMAYYDTYNVVILFGGREGNAHYDDTWEYSYSGNTWTIISPKGGVKPSARSGHAMAAGSSFFGALLYGGSSNIMKGETWIYEPDENHWIQKNPSIEPPKLTEHAMVYDSIVNKGIIFGGFKPGSISDETCAYDYIANTWTLRGSGSSPSERKHTSMAYDSQNQKTILFGGLGDGNKDDTWIYQYLTDDWNMKRPKAKDRPILIIQYLKMIMSSIEPIIDYFINQFPFFARLSKLINNQHN